MKRDSKTNVSNRAGARGAALAKMLLVSVLLLGAGGSFTIERPISSTADNVAIAKTGFEITITQALPWAATTTLEGTFEGEVDSAGTTVKVTFDKASVTILCLLVSLSRIGQSLASSFAPLREEFW